jgi:hypothetical protein
MEIVLDIAFVVAVTAFLKEQFSVTGRAVLIIAFIIALLFAFLPLIAGLFPPVAPWLEAFAETFFLFLAAAGTYDALRSFKK